MVAGSDIARGERRRAIGIDLGLRRVGVSVSDDAGLMAHPLCVLRYAGQDRLVRDLSELAESENAGSFVVGVPKNMDGTTGEGARRSVRFARKLERETGLAVALCDERLTTSQAEKEMIALGKSRKRRRMSIDEAAAVLILENYLRQKKLARETEGQ
jgi:putative Holliday junction resolvase